MDILYNTYFSVHFTENVQFNIDGL